MIINHAKYYGIMNDNHSHPSRTGGGRGRGKRALHRARLHPVRLPLRTRTNLKLLKDLYLQAKARIWHI